MSIFNIQTRESVLSVNVNHVALASVTTIYNSEGKASLHKVVIETIGGQTAVLNYEANERETALKVYNDLRRSMRQS